MSVRRGAARLARLGVLVGALLGALLMVGPAAVADENKIKIKISDSFSAGGPAGSVTVNVTKRTEGCVMAQTALGIRLAGLTPEQVRVQVAAGGDWREVSVAAGGADLVIADRSAPDKPLLCRKKSISVRYRLSFSADAPSGQVTVVAEASSAEGEVLGQDSGTTRVTGGRVIPLPTARASEPTPVATEEIEVPPTPDDVATAAAGPVASSDDDRGGGFGIGTVVMLIGVVMVGIGVALLVLLLRRGRGDRAAPEAGGYPDAGPPVRGYPAAGPPTRVYPTVRTGTDQTMVLPTGAGSNRVPPTGGGPTRVPPAGGGDPTLILPRTPHQRGG